MKEGGLISEKEKEAMKEKEMEEEGEKEMEEDMEKEMRKEDKAEEEEMAKLEKDVRVIEEKEDEKVDKTVLYEHRMKCEYKCPENSYQYTILGALKRCPRDFQHCKCKFGYYKSGYACKKISIRTPFRLPFPKPELYPADEKDCDYECPKYSKMYLKKKCPENYKDCKCKLGYYMHKDGYCVAFKIGTILTKYG